MLQISKTAYDIEWLGETYSVTPFHDSGVVHIQKLIKRKYRKDKWVTIFFSHIELLQQLTELATPIDKEV